MRKLIFILFTSLITISLLAQRPGGNRGAGMGQMSGRLYGKVVDAATNKGIDASSIQLIQSKFDTVTKKRNDVVLNGMLTNAKGEFNLENVPLFGPLRLKISAIGFKPFEEAISFNLKPGGDPAAMLAAIDKDLGNIKLAIDDKMLGNVTVTASKPLLQLGIDRKIFNVDKNIVSAGGTAVDVMRNVPSLSVDIDGNVALRNNTPQIFVDGRPTSLTLDQIPADAIETVEIITNPSAKFDASGGTAGILNIVLKKARKVGYNGNIRTSIDTRARIGAGADINVRQNKINVFASANLNQRKSISNGTTDRLTYFDNPLPDIRLHQVDRNTTIGNFGFGRAGIDYFIDNRNTLSVSGTFAKGKFTPSNTSDLYIDTLFTSPKSSYNQRVASSSSQFHNLGTVIGYKHNFPQAGRELTADLNYNGSSNTSISTTRTDFYKMPQHTVDSSYKQQQNGDGTNKNLVIQSDYTNPINDKSKIEMGVRAALRSVDNGNAFYVVNPATGALFFNAAQSVNYTSDDQVYAAYTTYSNLMGSFGYQVGLRAESSKYLGHLPDKNQSFEVKFPLSLFPSLFLSEKLKNDQEFQLNYTRRINRPNFFQLFPFTDYSDSLNITRGNPDLKPEFTNSIELSYSKIFKNRDNLLASLYFKHTTDLITRFLAREVSPVSGKDILVNTYLNANTSYVTGLELTAKNKINMWWDITSNINFYTSKISIDGQPEQDQFASYFAKVNNNFKLAKNLSFQLSGDYQSKTTLPPGGSGAANAFGGGGRGGGGGGGGMFGGGGSGSQGYIRPNYGVDAAIRLDFLKDKKASISLNVNDIFRTRRSDVHSESSFFEQDVFRRRDAQIFRLNFNFRFGKFDASLFKRKNTKADENQNQDNMIQQ